MCEITKCQVEDPGVVPGASTQVTAGNKKAIGEKFSNCAVEIATPLPRIGDRRPKRGDEVEVRFPAANQPSLWKVATVRGVCRDGSLEVGVRDARPRAAWVQEGCWRWPAGSKAVRS
jgi:hypothetical protein